MIRTYHILFLLLVLNSCKESPLTLSDAIILNLQDQAKQDSKQLFIDTFFILDKIPVSSFRVIEEEVSLQRRRKLNTSKIIQLNQENKEIYLQELNEINYLFPAPKDKERFEYIQSQITKYDDQINLNQTKLKEINIDINEIIAKDYSSGYDDLNFIEATYFIKGKVNNKILNDTVKVFVAHDHKLVINFTNVLYLDESK